MLRHLPYFAWGFLLWFAPPAMAQEDALAELYGQGVHAYNSGNYVGAYNRLTRAIDSGSEDPRCHYFRGLSYLKLGREPEAKNDFATAAEIEMNDTDRFYGVSKSLERIQGRARALLERYRSDARLRSFQEREQKRFDRYQRIRKNEPNVTVQPSPDEDAVVAPDKPNAEGEAPADDMPADGAEPEGDVPAGEMPAEELKPDGEPKPDGDDDPFGDAKPAEDMPAEDRPAEDMPADEPAADGDVPKAESDDPFADDAKPEGDMPAEEPAADGDKAKGDADDPFADDAKPEDDMPADEPAADGDKAKNDADDAKPENGDAKLKKDP